MRGQGLADEFNYYLEHQGDLVKQYNGKVIVIKDHKVLGVYGNDIDAVTETEKDHELGTFLVQSVSPGTDAYTQSYSRLMSS